MYRELIDLIKSEGDKLVTFSGKVPDNFKEKLWTTEHDHKIEQNIGSLINTFGTDHKLYSEEISNTFLSGINNWILDPISHTIRFIHGVPHYAIVISHLHKGEVVFACVYDPSMKELFIAEKGRGASLNGKKIHVKNIASKPLILFNPYPQGNWKMEEAMQVYKKIAPLGYIDAVGSMGLYCSYVAAGRAQLAVLINKDTYPIFAGKLIVEEAGGIFSDFMGNALSINTRGVIAGIPEYHKKALLALSTNG